MKAMRGGGFDEACEDARVLFTSDPDPWRPELVGALLGILLAAVIIVGAIYLVLGTRP